MYCVKCGVRLQDGTEKCPLCNTPVWNPESEQKKTNFPNRYPELQKEFKTTVAFILTVLAVIAGFVLLPIALEIDREFRWSGYVFLGIVLLYISVVLPLWFRKSNPVIFIPVSHLAAAGYLLYICWKTEGRWFLTFALPITVVQGLLVTAVAALLLYTKGKRGRYFIFGGYIVLTGISTVLIEFLEHITFEHVMFRWSPYSAAACFVLGMFLILTGIIRPLRRFLEKNFYI